MPPGVNTGFGGSADTRTSAVEELQRLLLRDLHYGMLAQPACGHCSSQDDSNGSQDEASMFASSLPLNEPVAATCMPESWARAAMIIRLNSLSSGASGVQISTIQNLLQLLEHDITPRIPIRGSISASGDLSPLSYIGGVMQGKPSLTVWTGNRRAGKRRIVKANLALAEAKISPVKLSAKEGLAIVNGTAISTGVAALAMHEAHSLAILSQLLTAMSVEALAGTDESFDPFFAQVRPHPGQEEAARNIYAFLAGSQLVHKNDGQEEASLRQDRYSIRTASQWIGPVLEDLLLAHQQVSIEINSVTDNPLVDVANKRLLHGGNFQAKAITSAMEKARQGCQTLGRMLTVQCTELINPTTNRGLPPNLVVDEPSESFIWKGTDIMIAALQSELGFLANPVGSHVQSAEMGNQALNSLALISARYTLDALDVLTQISAAHLIALCQALDLRVMKMHFLEIFKPNFDATTRSVFGGLANDDWLENLIITLFAAFKRGFDQTTVMDSGKRFPFIINSLQPRIIEVAPNSSETLVALKEWTKNCSKLALQDYLLTREAYIGAPNAAPYLGLASRHLYNFVRNKLRVPFMQEDTLRTPEPELAQEINGIHANGAESNSAHENVAQIHGPPANAAQTNELLIGGLEIAGAQVNGLKREVPKDTPTVSSFMTNVYGSMRTGELYAHIMELLRETMSKKKDLG